MLIQIDGLDPKAKALSIVTMNNDSDTKDATVTKMVEDALKKSGGDLDKALIDLYVQYKNADDKGKDTDAAAAHDAITTIAMIQKMTVAKSGGAPTVDIDYNDIYEKALKTAKGLSLGPRERAITLIADGDEHIAGAVRDILKEYITDAGLDGKSYDEKKLLLATRRDNVGWFQAMGGHGSGHGRKDMYNAAIQVLEHEETFVEEAKLLKKKETEAAQAKVETAKAMKITKFTGDGGKEMTVEIALREVFGDRDANGQVILEIDPTTHQAVAYEENPNPYSRDTGRMISDHNHAGGGIKGLKAKIREILTPERQADFMNASDEERQKIYAKLYAQFQEAHKVPATKEHPYPGQEYEEAIVILRRAEQIEKVRLDTQIASFASPDAYETFAKESREYAAALFNGTTPAQANANAAQTNGAAAGNTVPATGNNGTAANTVHADNDALLQVAQEEKAIKKQTSFASNPFAKAVGQFQAQVNDMKAHGLLKITNASDFNLGNFGANKNGEDNKDGELTHNAAKLYQVQRGLATSVATASGEIDGQTILMLQIDRLKMLKADGADKATIDAEMKDISSLDKYLTKAAKDELAAVLPTLQEKVTKGGGDMVAYNALRKMAGLAVA